MTEQTWTMDFLCSEKRMAAHYNHFASECVNASLRGEYLHLFHQCHQMQNALMKLSQSRGWHREERVPDHKVRMIYQKYASQKR